MLRFTFFGPFVIGCAAIAFSGVSPKDAYSQPGSGGYGGETGYGGGSGSPAGAPRITEEQRFQRGMSRVLKSLEQAETEEEKKRLLELGRKGLEWRYQSKLDARKQELEKLRQRLEQLEDDYARRAQAMPRVINLQLESLKLASEGLLNLEDVIGRQRRVGRGYGMEGGYGVPGRGGYGSGDYGGEMGGYGGEGYGAGSGGEAAYGSEMMSPGSQPIKPDEDPFQGLGDGKTTSEPDDEADQGRTSKLPGTIAEPPATPDEDDLFGAPSPDKEDPFDAGPPSEPSESEPDDPFSL